MKNNINKVIFLGVLSFLVTGCVVPKLGLNKSNNSENIQASDGSTNKAKTIGTGVVAGAVTGAVVGKVLKLDPKITAIAGAMMGAVAGDVVHKNNQKQAYEEQALANEEADYNAKTEELAKKIDLGKKRN